MNFCVKSEIIDIDYNYPTPKIKKERIIIQIERMKYNTHITTK